jgi:hypothetical protein
LAAKLTDLWSAAIIESAARNLPLHLVYGEMVAAAERAAILEIVREMECICGWLGPLLDDFDGEVDFSRDEPIIRHDSRCSHALAARIAAREGS